MSAADQALLVVAHGTVSDLDGLPAFLQQIRRGRPPSSQLVRELRSRYEAVGGSPLLETTAAQAAALERRVGRRVFVGMRFGDRPVEEALRTIAEEGFRRVLILPLAPFSVHVYRDAVRRCRDRVAPALSLACVPAWGTHAGLVEAFAEDIAAVAPEDARVILTAHSLPVRVLAAGDPYRDQVAACAAAVGRRLGREHVLAFQSQGAAEGEWIGPDLRAILAETARGPWSCVAVSPIGFLSEHVETLYDLDIEAKRDARNLGLGFLRIGTLGDDPRLVDVLASLTSTKTVPVE